MKKKNPFAQALRKLEEASPARRARDWSAERLSAIGRMGGKIGGPARAKKLKRAKRQEIARKAVAALWARAKTREQEPLS
jgi:hypothetical protein